MVLPMATNTPRIAVVDDDPFVLRGLRRLLRSSGFDVKAYASGAEFLNAKLDEEPDCVVLDLHMPQTSGFDVQVQLAQRGRSTPVIVITGNDTPESHARAVQLGAKAYLCKPVNDEALLAAIGAAIGGVRRSTA